MGLVALYVEHERPEVLKREIDVSQLRWYAYCMFEALANLHEHGIVHRDIKPGNYLFSREVNIGYLIDFNLAKDLHKKNRPLKRPKMDSGATAAILHYLLLHILPPKAGSLSTKKMKTMLVGQ